jgi:hypothetical protein
VLDCSEIDNGNTCRGLNGDKEAEDDLLMGVSVH